MAPLPPLADLDDVEDRLGRELTTDEQRKAHALLRDASAVVRSYARRDFTLGQTTIRLRPRGDKVLLQHKPVLEVLSVSTVISFGTTEYVTPTPAWSHPGGYEVFLMSRDLIVNAPTLDYNDDQLWVEVTYTHGYTEIPYDVMAVTANLVVRNMSVPNGGMVDMETIGPYTTRYASFTAGGPLALSGADRDILNRYRASGAHTIELR